MEKQDSAKNVMSLDEIRRSAKFHPSIWGDYFLAYDSKNTEITVSEHEELAKQKEMVKKLLAHVPDDSTNKMDLIDAIQRLGVGYHFEKQIEESLQYIRGNYTQHNSKDNDLRTVALRFRLLRQQGYNISCDDHFSRFLDNKGNFMESLENDVEGLLSLYEAANFGINGEEVLERAIEFCTSHLEALGHQMNNVLLSKRVEEALKMPIHKSLTRLSARKFISAYRDDESHNEILLNFAKSDFNLVQKIHQRELSELTRWWKKFDVANNMPYARDRIVECYFWIVGVYFEPRYSIARGILVKAISMASILDDTYEYATLDELQILTDAIERWDAGLALEDSPPHVQMCYKSLTDTYVEIEDEIEKAGDQYPFQYAKQAMQKLVRAYFEEAKWLYNNHTPSMEEYLKVSLVSGAYMMLSTTALVGMGDLVRKQDFDWITNEPLIVRAASVICRLMDDMVGDEVQYEQKPSSVLCYMKQYGVSRDKACGELRQQVNKAWKDLNRECLEPRPAPLHILMLVVNLSRVIHLLYSGQDSYGDSIKAKEWVKMVLVEPLTM